MGYTPKLNYGPHRMAKSDTNALVEEEIKKGGVGSGRRGHTSVATHDKFMQAHNNFSAQHHADKAKRLHKLSEQHAKQGNGISASDLKAKARMHEAAAATKRSR